MVIDVKYDVKDSSKTPLPKCKYCDNYVGLPLEPHHLKILRDTETEKCDLYHEFRYDCKPIFNKNASDVEYCKWCRGCGYVIHYSCEHYTIHKTYASCQKCAGTGLELPKQEVDKKMSERTQLKSILDFKRAKSVVIDARKKFVKKLLDCLNKNHFDEMYLKKELVKELKKQGLSKKQLKKLTYPIEYQHVLPIYIKYDGVLLYELDNVTWNDLRPLITSLCNIIKMIELENARNEFENIAGAVVQTKYEVVDYQICETCGADNPLEAKYCSECGEILKK